MTLNIGDIIAALPASEGGDPSADAELQALLARLSKRPVPVGVVHRLWALGSLQAKIALAYLAYWIRSGFGDADENTRRLNETHLRAALHVFEGMSYLRGAVMKVGQTLVNYPNVVPDEYVETLSSLHFDAPPMHYSLLREHVRNELGGDPEEVFAEFDPKAFAAASLGQVHRARLKTGEAVAVKIQYPNIARTIASDFRALSGVFTPMRLSADWENIKAQFEDVRKTLEQETDYELEAEMQRRASGAFKECEGVVVSRVYEAYSTKRVLTTELLDGRHLDRFLVSNPSESQRDEYGRLIMFSSFRLYYGERMCYADPHPGNYLFLKDGRLGLIDFGCCRVLSVEEADYSEEVLRASEEGGERMRRVMRRSAGLSAGEPVSEEHLRLYVETSGWFNDCIKTNAPFDFGDEAYMRRGFELLSAFPRKGYVRSQPVDLWIMRCLVGVRAMCHRLRARVNMHELHHQEYRPGWERA